MTSSLVGSEMCIRDRPHTMGHIYYDTPWTKVQGPCAAAYASLLRLGWTCLLYTSDAADDM
eukprot:8601760-Prorocentrum_lima.AAC.1